MAVPLLPNQSWAEAGSQPGLRGRPSELALHVHGGAHRTCYTQLWTRDVGTLAPPDNGQWVWPGLVRGWRRSPAVCTGQSGSGSTEREGQLSPILSSLSFQFPRAWAVSAHCWQEESAQGNLDSTAPPLLTPQPPALTSPSPHGHLLSSQCAPWSLLEKPSTAPS